MNDSPMRFAQLSNSLPLLHLIVLLATSVLLLFLCLNPIALYYSLSIHGRCPPPNFVFHSFTLVQRQLSKCVGASRECRLLLVISHGDGVHLSRTYL